MRSTMAAAAAAAVRMSSTTDLDSISPEHRGLSTTHPPGGIALSSHGPPRRPPPLPLPSPSEILGMMLKLKSVLRISGFVVTRKRGLGPVN